jgi:hypothetical protein
LTRLPEAGSSDARRQASRDPGVGEQFRPRGGNYYGQVCITVSAPTTAAVSARRANCPPARHQPGPVVQPTSLIFNAPAGGISPASDRDGLEPV